MAAETKINRSERARANPAPTVAEIKKNYKFIDDAKRLYWPEEVDTEFSSAIMGSYKGCVFMWVAILPGTTLQGGMPEIDTVITLYDKATKNDAWKAKIEAAVTFGRYQRTRKTGYVVVKKVS
jgi:hypothetical protein